MIYGSCGPAWTTPTPPPEGGHPRQSLQTTLPWVGRGSSGWLGVLSQARRQRHNRDCSPTREREIRGGRRRLDRDLPMVGVGSLCRRQGSSGIGRLVSTLHGMGICCHGCPRQDRRAHARSPVSGVGGFDGVFSGLADSGRCWAPGSSHPGRTPPGTPFPEEGVHPPVGAWGWGIGLETPVVNDGVRQR